MRQTARGLEYPAGEPAGAEEEDDDGSVVEDEVVAQAEAGAACGRWVPRCVARGKEGMVKEVILKAYLLRSR